MMAEVPANDLQPSTGYGPRTLSSGRYGRLLFDGDERRFEQWEVKFMGYMRLQNLKDVIAAPDGQDVDPVKNEEAFAELIQFLDDKSLSLVMRDAKDDGRKALKILKGHYAGTGKPRIISLYTELTSLSMTPNETVTDYIIRAETATAALRNAGETVSDGLLIAMVLKGLPDIYKPFVVVVTQNDRQQTFSEFKVALRSYEDTERARGASGGDSVLKARNATNSSAWYPKGRAQKDVTCFKCQLPGHIARHCENKPKTRLWCSHCRSSTHTDKSCRKQKVNKNGQDKVKQVVDRDDPDEQTFVFKVNECMYTDEVKGENKVLLVDCGATSHIITDKSKFTSFDESFRPETHYIELANGSRSNNVALKRGDVRVTLVDTDRKPVDVTLQGALYIPSYPQDIFSVQAATGRGSSVTFKPDSANLVYGDGTMFDIEKHGRLYYLRYGECKTEHDNVKYACDLNEWHRILGHCNIEDVKQLETLVDGMKVVGKSKPEGCDVCVLGKMTQGRSREPRSRSSVPLELVHTDLAGPVDPVSNEGFRYAQLFTDDYTGTMFVYFLKQKSDAVEATEKFLADSAPWGKVKTIRSDNGTEFTCQKYESLLRHNKIRHETSAPYSPHQNGTAERNWRTIFEMGRCLLIDAGLEKHMWPYAVLSAVYIRNRCLNRRIGKTPYEAMTGRKPDVSNMRVFGSRCFAYKQEKKKLDTRCTEGIFVGYDKGSPAYLVYYPDTGKVMRHRVVTFMSDKVTASKQTDTSRYETVTDDDDDVVIIRRPVLRANDPEQIDDVPVREIGHPAQPARAEAEGHTVGDTQTDTDQRYPRRDRKPPAYLNDYVSDFEDDEVKTSIDYCYRIHAFPQSYEEAVKSPESELWKAAMTEEMNSLRENDTFTRTTLPEGKKTVGGRWVYTVKESENGSQTYKARYVAKGYSQVKGMDYEETFAPTAKMTTLRVLMQLAAQNDLILHQMDVKTAYLNAPIDCDIYMEQPEGFEEPGNGNEKVVYKLNRSLYGLKQSGRNWNSLLHGYLLKNDFVQSSLDPCLYIKHVGDEVVMLLVWVDDLIIGASSDALMSDVKQMLKSRFKMKDLGRLSYFLGIGFEQGPGFVRMNQKRYICKILERFDMADCKPRSTPCEQKFECTSGSEEPVDPTRYREIVGSLVYAMTCTRPDLSYVVTKLSQHLSKPLRCHWVAAKHVLRYLKGTLDYSLCYRKNESVLRLEGYSDADWASSTDRRSISGYCFTLTEGGPLISWKSRKQATVALSSCEAEYIALAATVQEGIYLVQLLNDIGIRQESILIYEDNQGTMALAQNPVKHQRSKHIDVRHHFLRNEIKEEE